MTWELGTNMVAQVLPTVEWQYRCETFKAECPSYPVDPPAGRGIVTRWYGTCEAIRRRRGAEWLVNVLIAQLTDGYGDDEWEDVSPIWSLFTPSDIERLEAFTDGAVQKDTKTLTVERVDTRQSFAVDALTWILCEHAIEHVDTLLNLVAAHAIKVGSTSNGGWALYLDKQGWEELHWYEPNEVILLTDSGRVVVYAWPGGYPVFYTTRDNGALCPDCVEKNLDLCSAQAYGDAQWEVVGHGINYEDPLLHCDHCNERIESAYAEEEPTYEDITATILPPTQIEREA